MSNRKHLFVLSGLFAAAAMSLAACGGGDDSGTSAAPPPPSGGTLNPGTGTTDGPSPAPSPAPSPTPSPAPVPTTAQQIADLVATHQQKWAAGVPDTIESRTELWDACYLSGGSTKATEAALFSEDPTTYKASLNYLVGQKMENVQVLAERNTTNADGTARKEVDVVYDTVYADGTRALAANATPTTLIAGSSTGTPGCAGGDNKPALRFMGNRRSVGVNVYARNIAYITNKISDGSSNGGSVRREVRFVVNDPSKVATYVVVTGSGPAGNAGAPFSLKLLSPRLMRDAPEMKGLPGTGTYRDDDNFRFCWGADSNIVPDVAYADCTSKGVAGDAWGWTTSGADPAAADNGFAGQGWAAGAKYTFKVYADDGWKTINGHVGKTPIATYDGTLVRLPYTFAQMYAAPASYAFVSSALSGAQVADGFKTSGGTNTLSITKPAAPPTGGLPFVLGSAGSHRQGPVVGTTTGYPRIRSSRLVFPGSIATAATIPFDGLPTGASATVYGEFNLNYTDRNSGQVQTVWRYQ